MSTKEISEMIENGMTIGGHGYRHIRLGELSLSKQKIELSKMFNFLKKYNIEKNWIMCYPYGSFNKDTVSILLEKIVFLVFQHLLADHFCGKKIFLTSKDLTLMIFTKNFEKN